MNFIFSEVWWMNTIIAAIITGMFTLICSYIAYSYKIRKGLDTIERMEHTQESRQKELSGQHEKMSEKLSQEHQQISRDIRPYADKIVRIDSHMTDLVQRANQQDSLYHSLSREQKKMSDFIQHGIDGYHAVQAELLRLSAENQSLKQAVQEKDHRIACTQADLEQAHKRCEELEHRNNMLLRQQRQAKQGHEYDSIEL